MSDGVRWVSKPAVLAELRLERPVVVEASAGTGKTYLLQHLVTELVLTRGARLSEILLVTFTEKAAAEIRTRVRATLREVAHGAREGAPPEHAWIVDDDARGRALAALRELDTATIGTIHQFCQSTMRELGVLAGQPPLQASEVIPEPFPESWRSVLRRRICDAVFAGYWAQLPSTERRRVEEGARILTGTRAPPAPGLDEIEADARALVEAYRALGAPRMPNLDEHPFHERVGRPWTRKGPKKRDAYARWSSRLLEGLAAHVERDADWMALMLHVVGPGALDLLEAGEVPEEATTTPGACRSDAQRDFLAAARALSERARALAIAILGEDVATTMRRYHDEAGTLTFNEMIWRLRDALHAEQTRHDGAGPLVSALRRRYRWALIDEFQDTDEAQWDIFRTVFLRGAREREEHAAGGLVLVGDPKQAIYRFRGADFHAYRSAVEESTTRFGGQRVTLRESFRSTEALTRAIHDVQAHELFPSGSGVELVDVQARARCAFDDEDGGRPLTLLCLPPGADENGAPLVYTKGDADHALADGVAAEIARLLSSACGARVRPKHEHEARPLAAGDICVLARQHADLDVVARALRRAGVPYMHYKKRGLYQTPEALDLLDVLLAVQDPTRLGRVSRALATVFFAIAPARLERYLGLTEAHVVQETLTSWNALARAGDFPALLRALEGDTGVMQRLLFHEGERAATNLQQLLEQLLALHAEHGWGLDRVVDELRRRTKEEVDERSEADLLRIESERERVRLMTMHTAKGLEFPVVFLAGGYLGRRRADPSDPVVVHREGRSVLALNPREVTEQWRREEAEEEARLLYVAMTRAIAKLYLPWWSEAQVKDAFRPGLYARVKAHLDGVVARGGSELIGCVEATRSPRARLRVPGELEPEERRAIEQVRAPTAALERADAAYRDVLTRRRGPLLSSFTQLSAEVAAQPRQPRPDAIVDDPGREERIPDETGVDEAELGPLEWTHTPDVRIPGGTLAGLAFHEVLEELDLAAARAADGFDAWLAVQGEAVTKPFRQLGFDAAQREASARLVFETVRRPLDPALPGVRLCDLVERLPELDFRMAIPEEGHPSLAGAPSSPDASRALPFAARTGFLTGSLDLVFRHEGRAYVVDWKTNVIRAPNDPERYDYSPDAVRALTEESYGLQIEIYTVAMARWLGVSDRASYDARFGGVLYLYLRGFGRPGAAAGEGLYFYRPSFDELARWEARLATGVDYRRRRERADEEQAAWRAA